MSVAGFVAAGFESVAAEFERNWTERGDVGAAFAVVKDGELVVDLYGGLAHLDRGIPWHEDTLSVIFSGTKGLTAVCLLMLVDRGALDPDAPVADYWPEFAANGKADVLVKELVSHQARLPGIRSAVTDGEFLDERLMARRLAAQPQETDPRAGDVYHALTYGWLCGELVRRIDGRSIGRFFAEEIAKPLDLDAWIGLPESEEPRVATLQLAPSWTTGIFGSDELAADALLASVWGNPPLFAHGPLKWNRRDYHAAEIAAAGAIGTARSFARLYGCLARGGEIDGVRLMSPVTVQRATHCLTRRHEPLLDENMAFGFGFLLQSQNHAMGPAPAAFGHDGAGGSQHAAWPEEKVGFSYCMNLMRDDEPVDPRPRALLDALYDAIKPDSVMAGRRT